jgi:hypothetical protein
LNPTQKWYERYSLGRAVVFGGTLLLVLIAVVGLRHPASVQGAGSGLLWTNTALLLLYGAAGISVCYQGRPEVNTSLNIGARAGVLLGAAQVANHVIELFVPVRPFIQK